MLEFSYFVSRLSFPLLSLLFTVNGFILFYFIKFFFILSFQSLRVWSRSYDEIVVREERQITEVEVSGGSTMRSSAVGKATGLGHF